MTFSVVKHFSSSRTSSSKIDKIMKELDEEVKYCHLVFLFFYFNSDFIMLPTLQLYPFKETCAEGAALMSC